MGRNVVLSRGGSFLDGGVDEGRKTKGRHAVPRAWPPPTKFRAEIWGVGQVVGPYGKRTIKNKENRREPDRFTDTSRRRTHHVEETSV